jgi:hypothetical protein
MQLLKDVEEREAPIREEIAAVEQEKIARAGKAWPRLSRPEDIRIVADDEECGQHKWVGKYKGAIKLHTLLVPHGNILSVEITSWKVYDIRRLGH